jgi:hypothetical protein
MKEIELIQINLEEMEASSVSKLFNQKRLSRV